MSVPWKSPACPGETRNHALGAVGQRDWAPAVVGRPSSAVQPLVLVLLPFLIRGWITLIKLSFPCRTSCLSYRLACSDLGYITYVLLLNTLLKNSTTVTSQLILVPRATVLFKARNIPSITH